MDDRHCEINNEKNSDDDIKFINEAYSSDRLNEETISKMDYNDDTSSIDMDNDQCDSFMDDLKENLLDSVAKSDGFFKSQQVGESDLTFSEKREIASDLLRKNLPLFLQRYWKFIQVDHVPYFEAHRSNYEVNFYVTEIINYHGSESRKIRIKNRRYEALKQMVDEGAYFSDAEMKRRNPFLYDQMVGQHLTENERIAAYKKQYPDEKFSSFLLDQMEKNVENSLFTKQKDEDEALIEEEEDDTSEEESELEDDEPPVRKIVTGEEKRQLRSEFTNIMYESFLDGKDKDFDYSSVDNNAEYDSVHQRDIDEQERYFDDESSQSVD